MLSFKVYSNEIEDRLLVPFYHVLKITKKYPLTIEKVAKQITNGMDLREYKEEGSSYLRGTDIKRCQVNMLTPKKVNFPLKDIPEKIKLNSGDILITRKAKGRDNKIHKQQTLQHKNLPSQGNSRIRQQQHKTQDGK